MIGTVQHTKRQRNCLHVLGSGRCGNVAWLRADIINDGLLQPGNQEVGALAHGAGDDTAQSVENDGTVEVRCEEEAI